MMGREGDVAGLSSISRGRLRFVQHGRVCFDSCAGFYCMDVLVAGGTWLARNRTCTLTPNRFRL